MTGRRLLVVHAHPDDESITTGATMALYASQGVQVTLVTCTLGEQGEILTPEFAELEADHADQLGGLRIGELASAMDALGVTDHRFLGSAGRYRDSGMLGTAPNDHPRAFWRASKDEQVFAAAVADLVQVVRDVRPQVVVTYDANGDYGHPDHVMAHRVTTAAVTAAADPAYGPDGAAAHAVTKLYWTATPASGFARDAARLAATPVPDLLPPDAEGMGYGVPDDVVTSTVEASDQVDRKRAALAAHRTQVIVRDEFYALSNLIGRVIEGREHFRLVLDRTGRGAVAAESDLFAGVPASDFAGIPT